MSLTQETFLDIVPAEDKDKGPQTGRDAKGRRRKGKPHPHQHYEGEHAVQIGGAPSTLLNKEVKPIVKDD